MKSTTVREELVVALFDDAADIVKRLEALAPVMNDTRFALAGAARDLAAQVKPFEDQMHQIAAEEQYRALHYVRDQVEQTSRFCRDQQIQALKDAGRAVLKEELGTTMHDLITSLREIVEGSKRRETLRIQVTTAVASAALTACLLVFLLPSAPTTAGGGSPRVATSVESPSPVPAAVPAAPPLERTRARK